MYNDWLNQEGNDQVYYPRVLSRCINQNVMAHLHVPVSCYFFVFAYAFSLYTSAERVKFPYNWLGDYTRKNIKYHDNKQELTMKLTNTTASHFQAFIYPFNKSQE
jgi:hypothetical protein